MTAWRAEPKGIVRDLLARGWVPQDIMGLWRHPWKAHGSEVTTRQAVQIEMRGEHEEPIRVV